MIGGNSSEDDSYRRLPMPKHDDEDCEDSIPLHKKQIRRTRKVSGMIVDNSSEDASYRRLPIPRHDDEGSEDSSSSNKKQVAVKTKKRRPPLTSQSDTNLFSDYPTPAYATNSRSECKRLREQNRRDECNRGLDQLMALLIDIDPDIKALAAHPVKARKGAKHSANVEGKVQLLGRAELISRTVSVLDQLNRDNKQQRLIIEQLRSMFRSGDARFASSASVPNEENPESIVKYYSNPFHQDFKMISLEMSGLPAVDSSLHHQSLHVGAPIIIDEAMAKIGSPSTDMELPEQYKRNIMLAGTATVQPQVNMDEVKHL